MQLHRLLWATLPLVALACGKKSDSGHVDGTVQTDQVIKAWKKADLNPESFAPADAASFGAAYCSQGRVQGVDAIVCEYRDDASLDRGEKSVLDHWNREGVRTAITGRSGRTLVAVVDRAGADPNGKAIDKLIRTFKSL